MDENGVIKSAVSGNDITGYRDIPLKDVLAEYEKRRKSREDKLARKEAEKKAEEAEKKAERARLEKIKRDYESSFGKGKL
jgi:predicted Holliday junction resolvase-like endonuclease